MIKNLVSGAIIGITELIPGISGSTLAKILGLYERLINSLSILTTSNRTQALPFLLTFGLGIFIGFISSIHIIDYLLNFYRTPTIMFFVGIIVGYLPLLWKEAFSHCYTKRNLKHFSIIILFFGIVSSVQCFTGKSNIDITNLDYSNYLFLVFAGFIASTALVLPGISGALILTILGVYDIAIESLVNLYLPVILTIGLGVVLGLILSSKIINYLLFSFPLELYLAMVGLVGGSIIVMFNNIERTITPQIVFGSLVTFIFGTIFVYFLNHLQNYPNAH